MKAIVARTRHAHRDLEHDHHGALYDDPGGDFCTRRIPDKAKRRAIEQLRVMGYTVTLEPTG